LGGAPALRHCELEKEKNPGKRGRRDGGCSPKTTIGRESQSREMTRKITIHQSL